MEDYIYKPSEWYSGQAAVYDDRVTGELTEVRLAFPYYDVYINGRKLCTIPIETLEKKKNIKIPFCYQGNLEFYIVWMEEEDEIFIMRKCDGTRRHGSCTTIIHVVEAV